MRRGIAYARGLTAAWQGPSGLVAWVIVNEVDDDLPATNGELRAGLADLGAQLRAELASKADLNTGLASLGSELRAEMRASENRIILEIGRAVNAVVEQVGANARVVDEKYQDLPARVTVLEEHAADFRLHARPPAPKRSTKPKPKSKPKR